ncbi:isochorismatase family protein [Actinomadura darangshiensis]|uniref:Isochorismatase family protein n=1 Tax=Actinomadura darangshiensis TaxID=705336 RepID=A0A4R5A4G8_9ACTN|nr:isochorismatase family protein [Actinomadura darangshiensis]TDD64382.1 isochorismatase family protein [Actinomadura darangshiensis]
MSEGIQDRLVRAGFGGTVRRGRRPALVVVDLQKGFTDPGVPIGAEMAAEIEAAGRLVRAFHEAEAPVVFTTIAFAEHAPSAWLDKSPGLDVLRQGSALVEVDERLPRRQADPVLTKTGASAFFGTGLAGLLRAYGADTVVVCGTTTSGCVRATAVDSVQYGFPTLVVADAVADRVRSAHDASLIDVQAKYADVIALEEALTYLTEVR